LSRSGATSPAPLPASPLKRFKNLQAKPDATDSTSFSGQVLPLHHNSYVFLQLIDASSFKPFVQGNTLAIFTAILIMQ
jgi:hypothetical protein